MNASRVACMGSLVALACARPAPKATPRAMAMPASVMGDSPNHPRDASVELDGTDSGGDASSASEGAATKDAAPRRAANIEEWVTGADRFCRTGHSGWPTKREVEAGREYCSRPIPGVTLDDRKECSSRCLEAWVASTHFATDPPRPTDDEQKAFDEALHECLARVEQTLGREAPPCRFKQALPPGMYEQCDRSCRERALQLKQEWEPRR